MTAKAETPKTEQEQKKETKTRKPREKKEGLVSLVGKKPEDQRKILIEAIEKRKAEIKELEKKLDNVNKKLKDKDWDSFTSMFTPEEIRERLTQKEN